MVGTCHCHCVGYCQVVDTAEEAYTFLEYAAGHIVVVVYLDVAVARQCYVEADWRSVIAIYGGKNIDEFHHKLAIYLGIFYTRLRTHPHLLAVG